MSKAKRLIAGKAVLAEPAAAATAAPNTWTFNPAQLASYNQARQLREFLNRFNFQILPNDDEHGTPKPQPDPNFPWMPPKPVECGIFLYPWESGPGGFEEPHGIDPETGEELLYLGYKSKNGKQNNVGLCIDKFKRYPGSPRYVVGALYEDFK